MPLVSLDTGAGESASVELPQVLAGGGLGERIQTDAHPRNPPQRTQQDRADDLDGQASQSVQNALTDFAFDQLPRARQHGHVCDQLECIDDLRAWFRTCRCLIGHGEKFLQVAVLETSRRRCISAVASRGQSIGGGLACQARRRALSRLMELWSPWVWECVMATTWISFRRGFAAETIRTLPWASPDIVCLYFHFIIAAGDAKRAGCRPGSVEFYVQDGDGPGCTAARRSGCTLRRGFPDSTKIAMRAFAPEPTATHQIESATPAIPGRARSVRDGAVSSILHLQRTVGNRGVQRFLHAQTEGITFTGRYHTEGQHSTTCPAAVNDDRPALLRLTWFRPTTERPGGAHQGKGKRGWNRRSDRTLYTRRKTRRSRRSWW